jgi:hypothetical protein
MVVSGARCALVSSVFTRRTPSHTSLFHDFKLRTLGEVHFWRDFLARDGRRITLKFGSQIGVIDWKFLEFTVTSPGIPGDSKSFANVPAEDDLFSSSDLDSHLAGVSPEWDDEDDDDVIDDDE